MSIGIDQLPKKDLLENIIKYVSLDLVKVCCPWSRYYVSFLVKVIILNYVNILNYLQQQDVHGNNQR